MQMFLRVAYQALFDRFPSLILGMNERDIPWEYDVAFIRPASLPLKLPLVTGHLETGT